MDYTEVLHGVAGLLRDASKRRLLFQPRLEHARALAAEGRDAEAIAEYRATLKALREDAGAWHELAALQLKRGEAEEAMASLIASIEADPARTQAHHEFGRICAAHPGPAEVVSRYLSASGISCADDPQTPAHEPGSLLALAEGHCRRVLADDPSGENYLRLAHVQTARLHLDDASETLGAALTAGHERPPVLEALAVLSELSGRAQQSQIFRGDAHYFDEQYGLAVERYTAALEAGPVTSRVHSRLAISLARLHRYQDAIGACRRGLSRSPDDPVLLFLWSELLQSDGRTGESQRVATEARERFPANARLGVRALLTLPLVYETSEEIVRYREAYAAGLATLTQQLHDGSLKASDSLPGTGSSFYLAYQGRDDKALQMSFGRLVHRVAADTYPQWSRPIATAAPAPGAKIRVGYVSANLYRHTVAKLFLGWLKAHDKDRFEVHAYHLGTRIDPMTHQYARAADRFRHLQGPFEHICRRIAEDQLHVLVYLDIGMDEITTRLASLFLAPVQCAAWGHPVTTGLPTLDYFISSELMEPANADEHYSERLIRLPGIGVNVPQAHVEENDRVRADFGLRENDVVYLSPQSSFKYLPQHDQLFPRIAARVPNSKFVFLSSGSDNVTNILKGRLLRAFDSHGLDGHVFVVFLPGQGHRDYLGLNGIADVFLDQPGWSGGMTTIEALGCHLPVVTWPGQFMRGRHSCAFLRKMGLEETIASDLDNFVDIAARLGNDAAWRQQLSREIAGRKHLLFNDSSCVAALEGFYSDAVSRLATR